MFSNILWLEQRTQVDDIPELQFTIWEAVESLFLITNQVIKAYLGVIYLNQTPMDQFTNGCRILI